MASFYKWSLTEWDTARKWFSLKSYICMMIMTMLMMSIEHQQLLQGEIINNQSPISQAFKSIKHIMDTRARQWLDLGFIKVLQTLQCSKPCDSWTKCVHHDSWIVIDTQSWKCWSSPYGKKKLIICWMPDHVFLGHWIEHFSNVFGFSPVCYRLVWPV